MAKKAEATKLCRGINSPLLKCSGIKQESDFYNSWSKFEGDKTCYCKECCKKIYDYYLDETRNIKSALYYTCAKVDVPFIKELYENLNAKSIEGAKDGRKFTLNFNTYFNELHKKSTQKEILGSFDATDCDINEVDATIKTTEIKKKELDDFKSKWGNQDSIDDYEFLERTYNRYMTNFDDELSPQQQDTLCDLCRDRLLLRKLSENGCQENDMITKVQNRVNNLMKTLKIDNFEGNQKKTLSEQSFVEKIKMMEETKPIELYAKSGNDYIDYTKRKKYYTDLVLRPLCNTLAGHKDFNIDMSDLEQYNLKGDR
ncbi:MAG: hypothetical protein KBT03_10485 [Bacteroidales bacterium]|nr:hypothetical protein [Candidatus Scybalousia scybalohippi]